MLLCLGRFYYNCHSFVFWKMFCSFINVPTVFYAFHILNKLFFEIKTLSPFSVANYTASKKCTFQGKSLVKFFFINWLMRTAKRAFSNFQGRQSSQASLVFEAFLAFSLLKVAAISTFIFLTPLIRIKLILVECRHIRLSK